MENSFNKSYLDHIFNDLIMVFCFLFYAVDLDEVDGQPVRQESSRTAGVVTGRGQGRNVTITGNNNFAIIGGTNSNVFMH